MVIIIEIGSTIMIVGRGYTEIPKLWKYHISKIDTIAPNDMNSPCAKFENLRTVYIKVTPRAPRANWHPYDNPGIKI